MANIRSQIKRNKQNAKRRTRNRIYRGTARSMVRKAELAIAGTDKVQSEESVKRAVIALDKAANKGIIHKNNAARRKSRLMKKMNEKLAV